MNSIICLLAIGLDRIVGDPKGLPHPVIWIGNWIAFLEKRLNRGVNRRLKGALTVLLTLFATLAVVGAVLFVSYKIHWAIGIAIEVLLIAIALAQKSLDQAAMVVYRALEANDMEEARTKLGWIVGRDTAHLEEPEVVRGVVETVSENTSDGVTAPLFYALLFGAIGAWIYKAINTLDSMVAYKNERYSQFGYIAAKLDDIANYIPSRLTGLLILLTTKNVKKLPLAERWNKWKRDAKKHPSPNSGYLEAATAYQLGIRLGGNNSYGGKQSFRAFMGEPLVVMNREHIKLTVRHMYTVTIYFLLLIGGIIFGITCAWSKCIGFI
ncbi:adenosylcobinamide-phosphate synthase CbiB [Lysinibacillus sp. 54212]|uniref:adenosylcobinamide-phosphate synthase CbiB n=1 Tax=Lysinibacillus sp. 54212 TaxID=3119829 RepID=UPI002FCB8CF6